MEIEIATRADYERYDFRCTRSQAQRVEWIVAAFPDLVKWMTVH